MFDQATDELDTSGEEKKIICPKCGAENGEDATFCENCRANLLPAKEKPREFIKHRGISARAWLVILAIIIIIAAGNFLYFRIKQPALFFFKMGQFHENLSNYERAGYFYQKVADGYPESEWAKESIAKIDLVKEMAQKKKEVKLIEQQAKRLNLTYEQVKEEPKKYIGKPIIWPCVLLRGTTEIYGHYRGDFTKPVIIYTSGLREVPLTGSIVGGSSTKILGKIERIPQQGPVEIEIVGVP